MEDAPCLQRIAGERDIAAGVLEIPCPFSDDIAEEWIVQLAERWGCREEYGFAIALKD